MSNLLVVERCKSPEAGRRLVPRVPRQADIEGDASLVSRWRLTTLGFEVQIGEVDVPVSQHMQSQHLYSLSQPDLDETFHKTPVVHLSPGDRVRGIVGRSDSDRPRELLSINIERYVAATT